MIRRFAVVVLCVALFGCGSQTPTNPTQATAALPTPEPVVEPPSPPPPPPASLGGGTEVLVGAGDIGACDQNSELTARLLDGIAGTIFTLGDHAYPRGAWAEFMACYEPTWGRHKSRTYPSPGNHDYATSGALPYYEYFGARAGPAGLGAYSYDVGTWHVISLNSERDIPAQVAWLTQDLDVHRHKCTLAYWHSPLYSSGPHGSTMQVRDLWRLLYKNNAEVVVNGDAHMYERFAPQDHTGQNDPIRGIREFVVGTGGAPLHAVRADIEANSEVILLAFGVLKLTLAPNRYDWEFIPVSGPGDRGSGTCH